MGCVQFNYYVSHYRYCRYWSSNSCKKSSAFASGNVWLFPVPFWNRNKILHLTLSNPNVLSTSRNIRLEILSEQADGLLRILLKIFSILNLWPSWDSSSNRWACLPLKLRVLFIPHAGFPLSCGVVNPWSDSTKRASRSGWRSCVCTCTASPHESVYTHWCSMCTNTLWLEGHPALFSWLCGGFLLPVNLSCGAHGPAVAGWLRGHWQGYRGNPGARKCTDTELIAL